MKTLESSISAYIAIADKIAEIRAEADKQVRQLKEFQLVLENFLREEEMRTGVTSFKTPHGTAYFAETSRVSVGDWEVFLRFALDSGQEGLIKRGASKTSVDEFVAETGSPPPGVNFERVRVLHVRRPSKNGAK